jgi:hypothetical protein
MGNPSYLFIGDTVCDKVKKIQTGISRRTFLKSSGLVAVAAAAYAGLSAASFGARSVTAADSTGATGVPKTMPSDKEIRSMFGMTERKCIPLVHIPLSFANRADQALRWPEPHRRLE